MRQRFEVLNILVKWKNMIKKQTDKKMKALQIDKVTKYKNQFLQFGQNNWIGIHFKIDKYGVSKKVNRTLLKKVQRLLSNAQYDKSFGLTF